MYNFIFNQIYVDKYISNIYLNKNTIINKINYICMHKLKYIYN